MLNPFIRRYNTIDVFTISIALVVALNEKYLYASAILVIGVIISVIGEEYTDAEHR